MKTSNLYEIKNRYPERKWPLYDAFCRQCDHVSKAWDYRRNALKDIRDHLRTEHHIVPGVAVHVSNDEDGLSVMVFGTEDEMLARELALHKLVHGHGYGTEEAAEMLLPSPTRERGNIVPPFGYWVGEGYGWIWMVNPKGRSNPMVWSQQ